VLGLKSVSLDELGKAGLKLEDMADSKRYSVDQQVTPEDKSKREILWQRILDAHNKDAAAARAWLKTNTAYKAKVDKETGKQVYPAGAGHEDIMRVKEKGLKFLEDKINKLKDDLPY
jgi:hypothetical protein